MIICIGHSQTRGYDKPVPRQPYTHRQPGAAEARESAREARVQGDSRVRTPVCTILLPEFGYRVFFRNVLLHEHESSEDGHDCGQVPAKRELRYTGNGLFGAQTVRALVS
eukprot:3655129-Prymnesium_polylepis.1